MPIQLGAPDEGRPARPPTGRTLVALALVALPALALAGPARAQAPVASFAYTPESPLSGEPVTFSSTSTGTVTEPRLGPRRRRRVRRRHRRHGHAFLPDRGRLPDQALREPGRRHAEADDRRPRPSAAGGLRLLPRPAHRRRHRDLLLDRHRPRRADRGIRLGPRRRLRFRRRQCDLRGPRVRVCRPSPGGPSGAGPRRSRGRGLPAGGGDGPEAGAAQPVPRGAAQRRDDSRWRASEAARQFAGRPSCA